MCVGAKVVGVSIGLNACRPGDDNVTSLPKAVCGLFVFAEKQDSVNFEVM